MPRHAEETGRTPVERLSFGREDAERDMAEGLLRDGFRPTPAYRDVVAGRKTLVVGRKGTGKSAICMQLAAGGAVAADAPPGAAALALAPDDAAGGELRRFALQGLNGDTARSLIWRYVFAVHAARHLVAHAREAHGRGGRGKVRSLRRFLRDNGELREANLVDRVVHGAKALRTSLALEAFGLRAEVQREGGSEGARAQRQLEIVEQEVAGAFRRLGCAGTHPPLLLLVDQIEQVWSSDEESNSMVIGLLLAAKWAAGTYAPALRCVLFLRSDIYDSLVFPEGDKFRGDELRIDWSAAELKELVRTRAAASLGRELSEQELWGGVFPESVDGEPTAEYLLARSLARPRDVIQYSTSCRDVAFRSGHLARIAPEDVRRASEEFSRWKLKDLVQEYIVVHPYLDPLLALFQNREPVVAREELAARLERSAGWIPREYPSYFAASTFTPERVLDILFEVGFLGARRGEPRRAVYATANHLGVQPHDEEFEVHPCFRPALGLTRPHQDARHGAEELSTSRSVLYAQSGRGSSPAFLLQRVSATCRGLRERAEAADVSERERTLVREAVEALESRTAALLREAPGRAEQSAHLGWVVARLLLYAAELGGAEEASRANASLVRSFHEAADHLTQLHGGSYGGSGNSG